MWSIILITAAAVVMILIDVPKLRREKKKKELLVFSILLAAGCGLSIAHSLHVQLPNPLDFITVIFRPVSDRLSGFLT